jgi:hypothetical protein
MHEGPRQAKAKRNKRIKEVKVSPWTVRLAKQWHSKKNMTKQTALEHLIFRKRPFDPGDAPIRRIQPNTHSSLKVDSSKLLR